MKKVYSKIWRLALPYYKDGRPMDVAHVKWMMCEAEKICRKETVDESILLPLVILHDVGYGVSAHAYFEKNLKKRHMVAGARIAKDILTKVGYDARNAAKISRLVSVHDNWIFGKYEEYRKSKELHVFNDLDFLWLISPKGFDVVRKILNKTKPQMVDYVTTDVKHKNLPFKLKSTKRLYDQYVSRVRK